MLTTRARVAVAARVGADDGGLRLSLWRIWCDHLREQDGDHLHADSACTGIVLNATGQQYRQTTFTYLGGVVTKAPNLSAGWMSFGRYTRELYDRPKAFLLHLRARMMKSKVVEVFSHTDARYGPPLENHYNKLRTTHHRMLLQILNRSLVQVVEQPHHLLQRRSPANRM